VRYQNFNVAIYVTNHNLEKIVQNPDFERGFAFIEKHINVGKVYLETYRGRHLVARETVLKLKDFFGRNGIETSGGFTPDVSGNWEFKTFCYTNPEHLDLMRKVVQYTAELFDEIILDDFYFTNCKCQSCIRAKGDRSWSDFRTEITKQVTEEILMKTAKEVNPHVNVIIKYPNWYDHYQSTGYNLKDQPRLCDKIYTGTETRDPQYSQQNLPRYISYFLMRYLENVKPGGNGGGWFDAFDCLYNLGSFAEQCYLTLFAKAREVTLFCLGSLLTRETIFVPIAGYAFEKVDQFLGELGNPLGIACYKPYHSSGENYLHGFLGMLGLPLEPFPEFPEERDMILLTESAQQDPQIVERIKGQLNAGKNVAITSGLLKALTGKGIEEIAEIRCSDHQGSVDKFGYPMYQCSFGNYADSAVKIMIPQVEFSTNDCVPLIVAFAENKNYPVLLQVRYGAGILYVLTIPENHGDLYNFPAPVLDQIRRTLMQTSEIRLEGPANLGLFLYDNRTFIVESFLRYNSDVKIIMNSQDAKLVDLISGDEIKGWGREDGTEFQFKLSPTTYRVFRYEA
jgi:hypothetical protein